MARRRNSRSKGSGNNMKKSVIIYLSPFTACPACPSKLFRAKSEACRRIHHSLHFIAARLIRYLQPK